MHLIILQHSINNYGVLPELIGKWYSKEPIMPVVNVDEFESPTTDIDTSTTTSTVSATHADATSSTESGGSIICYCQKPESGDMIGCDFPNCSIEWFHQSCLRIKAIPKGKWYCPDCRKLFKGRHTPH